MSLGLTRIAGSLLVAWVGFQLAIGQAQQSQAGAAISGIAVEDQGRPVERAVVILAGADGLTFRRTFVTRDDGLFEFNGLPAGRFDLTASRSGNVDAAFGQRRPGLPGAVIRLGAGDRRTVEVRLARAAVITGTVMTERGERLARVAVTALCWLEQAGRRFQRIVSVAITDDRGVYRLFNLAPGAYTVGATPTGLSPVRTLRSDGSGQLVRYAPALYAGAQRQSEATPIRISAGEERTGVDLTVQLTQVFATTPPAEAERLKDALTPTTGRVVFEAGPASPPATKSVRVEFWPEPRYVLERPAFYTGSLDPQNRFTVTLGPGRYSLDVRASQPWTVKSAITGGRDIAEALFDVPLTGAGELVITMTSRITELTGQVLGKDGAPTFDAAVVAFPADERHWWPGSRRIRLAQPDTDGQYVLRGLPAGEYLIAAADVGPDDVADRATLASLRAGAVRVSLGEDEKQTTTVRILK